MIYLQKSVPKEELCNVKNIVIKNKLIYRYILLEWKMVIVEPIYKKGYTIIYKIMQKLWRNVIIECSSKDIKNKRKN